MLGMEALTIMKLVQGRELLVCELLKPATRDPVAE